MEHGFPYDEITPISCTPLGPNFKNKKDLIRNDAMGNISLTLLDNLDTLIIMEKWSDLETALEYLKSQRSTFFHQDVIIQVFEITIRSLGGLLSAHLLLTDLDLDDINYQRISNNYDGFLLTMANDLGSRLLPAFKTTNNIPVPRINLAKGITGVPYKFQQETCTSGATTPVLEFTLLSRLTGNPDYEYYGQATFWKIWSNRLHLDLLPMTLSPIKSEWKDSITGIGASIDSFYEYSVKLWILFNDNAMWEAFKVSYKALMTHLVKGSVDTFTSLIFANVGTEDGLDATVWIDLLAAFWTGVQTLAGQLKHAIGSHMVFLKLWDYYDLIPERWNCLMPVEKLTATNIIGLEWYPLRPEFVESTYYLYRATRDPMYLQIGERILYLFEHTFKDKCGFKGLQDIRTGKFQDRMESFVLSETLKYLYLLFDEEEKAFLHSPQMSHKNWVFSTEGHPLWYRKELADHDVKEISNKDRDLFVESQNLGQQKVIMDGQVLVEPFDQNLDKCETNPFTFEGFMKSNYYSMKNLFSIDYKYEKYLQRPSYLDHDGYIELQSGFYDKFTLFPTALKSVTPSNTRAFDLFIGNKSEIKHLKLYVVERGYLLPEFKDLRITIEFLNSGKIDLAQKYISQEYISQQNQAISERNVVHDILTRITKINGIFILPQEIIFIPRFEIVLDPDQLEIINDRLLINGYLVDNVRIV